MKNVEIKWNCVTDAILGDDAGVTGIRLKSTVNDAMEELMVSGVFIAIGHKPNTDLSATNWRRMTWDI